MPPLHSTNDESYDLLSELQSHNTYFDNLVNSIPAKLYVAGASGDAAYNPKYMHGQHKESKEARRARNKLEKDNKYNPEKRESTLDVKRRVAKEKEEMEEEDSDVGDDVIMSDGDGEEDDNDNAQTSTNTQDKKKDDTSIAGFTSRIEMLRAKLHAKMAEKRSAAGISDDTTTAALSAATNPDTSSPALVSKRAARRAEKRKRQEAAKQRNKKKLNSIAESKSKSQERVIKKDLGGSTYNAPSKSTTSQTTIVTTAAQDLATIDYQSIAGLKPKVDGALQNKSLLALTGGGKKKNKKKSLEKLLADAERKQARLKELKQSSVEEDRIKAKNIEWGETMKVAG